MAKRKRKEVDRRPVGLHVDVAKSGPLAYALYEVTYDTGKEFETVIERGNYIHGWPGMRPVKMTPAEKAHDARFTRPDVSRYIQAAVILLEPIAHACWDADDPPKKKKGKKRG